MTATPVSWAMESSRKGAPDLGGEVAACLARHLPDGGKVAVGYSGGLDSVVLLHALWALRGQHPISLTAVHVHHGLSPQADAWADHCRAVCSGLEVALGVFRVQVTPAGRGLEAAAREARYGVFGELDVDALAVAHHEDDQAETVLLQLRRGAGIRGLAAMPEARRLGEHTLLLRPLLGLTRSDLERYARDHGLAWVEDESNQDPSLARNHVRHAVLPPLNAAIPGMSRSLAAAAHQFAEWADLLDDLADSDRGTEPTDGPLDVGLLARLPEPRARNLLRRVLEQRGVAVRRGALVEATRQLREASPNAQVRVDFGEDCVLRFRGGVRVVPVSAFAPVPDLAASWRGEARMGLGPAGHLEFSPTGVAGRVLRANAVSVRHRRAGDRMRLRPGQLQRPLKDLLREAGIPPWQRPWLPVVEVDGQVAWVAGLGWAADMASPQDGQGWAISWVPPW